MFDWITGLMDSVGLLGVAFLMFAENVFPPIPSEVVMPLAGFTALRGGTSLVLTIVAGTVGSIAGALLYYWLGQKLGLERIEEFAARHGRWLTLTPEEVRRANAWFERHGRAAVFFGRLVPGVRTLISVPAGISGMPMAQFVAWSTAGTVIWTGLLAGAGYLLGNNYDLVAAWLNPVANVVVGGLVAIYLWRVVTFGRRSSEH